MRVAAVIPAYNEELTVGSVILSTKEFVDEVIIIDDGSRDNTTKVSRLAGAHVITLEQNMGQAGAIIAGLNYAYENGFDAIVLLDADGQMVADDIPAVVGPVLTGEADMVLGSRFLKDDNEIPTYRQFGQKVLNLATNISSEKKTSDCQSGFRSLNRKGLQIMTDIESNGFNYATDMLDRANDFGLRIVEVPVSVRYDVPNSSKKNPLTHGIGVLTRIINVMSYRRPLQLFGSIGLVLVTLGALVFFGTLTSFEPFSSIKDPYFWGSGLIILGAGSGIAALLLNSQAILKKELMDLRLELHHNNEER